MEQTTQEFFEARLLREIPGIVHITPNDKGYLIGAGIDGVNKGKDYITVLNDDLNGKTEDQCFDYVVEKWNNRETK